MQQGRARLPVSRAEKRALAAILLAALAVKLAVWGIYLARYPSGFISADTVTYHDSALALLANGAFAVSPGDPTPQTVRTPGYPLFLAAVYALAGDEPAAAVLAQIVLSLATIWLVYRLCRRIGGVAVGVVAAALLALDTASHLYSVTLLTETLFTLLLTAALACGIFLFDGEDRRSWALGLGVALAAACLVRPVAYYLVVPVALGLLVHGWKSRWGRRETALALALVLVPFWMVVGGWQLRNLRVSGSSAFSHVDGGVFLFYRGADIVARRDGIGFMQAHDSLEAVYGGDAPVASYARANAEWRAAGMKLIRENPGIYAQTMLSGFFRTLLVPAGIPFRPAGPEPGLRNELREKGFAGAIRARLDRRGFGETGTLALGTLHVVVVLGGVAYCLWRMAVERRMTVVDAFLLGVLLYMLVIQAGPTAGARTRVPVEPILALFAARGLVALWRRWRPGTASPLRTVRA